jgi:glycosyltransferase involved in cell wall biosynthesis
MRIAVVGVSTRPVCGVRDHARLLAQELADDGVPCSLHWLSRSDGTPAQDRAQDRAQVRAWTSRLARELDDDRPDAILWHYSVFAYSYRGLPLFVLPTVSVLRRSRIPVISFMHELAYPWGKAGLKGRAWALTQRLALIPVMRVSSAAIVTADFRAQWLTSRLWLSRRPPAVAPVFSNLPAPATVPPAPAVPAPVTNPLTPTTALSVPAEQSRAPADASTPIVGLFGYDFEPAAISLVVEAVRMLRDRGVQLELKLLGAPGASSPAGWAWLAAAEVHGASYQLSFSGVLSAQDLSNALASCEVLLYADPSGPASRKTTLAASLACGRPVIALEGRRRWPPLIDAEAARMVARTPGALADALHEMLADERDREALGARGRAFAEQTMSVAHAAEVVRGCLDGVLRSNDAVRSAS